MILPALLLTLDKYSSWRVGRVVPMIRSAVRTTLHSLLCLHSLNQTVIEVQRADSSAGEGSTASAGPYNGFNANVPLQVLRKCGAQESE